MVDACKEDGRCRALHRGRGGTSVRGWGGDVMGSTGLDTGGMKRQGSREEATTLTLIEHKNVRNGRYLKKITCVVLRDAAVV